MLQAVLRRYAQREAAAVAPFIVGRRVLDLGTGEGYVAAELRRRAWTCGTDVGPFGRVPGPYVVYDGTRLPFADGCFDTTVVLLTLHHCAPPEPVLDEAVRVTRARLIVLESVYRTRAERFWLELLDGRLNGLRHGGRMAAALAVRRPEEWDALFAARRLVPVARRWLGGWWERIVHHPLLYVLDVPGAPRDADDTTSSVRATVSPKRLIAKGGRSR